MNKDKIIVQLISNDEGRQRLAHSMVGSNEPFVYVPSSEGFFEHANANYLRSLAKQNATSPAIARLLENMAKEWEEYAKVPRWKKILIEVVIKIFG